jgi:DNA repair protein RadD
MFQDRPYQTAAVDSIWEYFQSGGTGNPLVAMPTGTGKSIVIARFLQSIYNKFPYQRIMMLTHVKELIAQNYEKLRSVWPFAPVGVYSAGLNKRDIYSAITFAGIASVWKKAHSFGHIDLVLIDEAHLLSPNDQTMYRSFLNNLLQKNPHLKVIGFTATPWRLGHGHLTDPTFDKEGKEVPALFSDVCFDITGPTEFNKLISEGYLCSLVPKRTHLQLEVDGLHLRGGEFNESEMQERFDKDEITEAALREALEVAGDRKHWLIFASGIEHAENVGAMLNSFGVPAGVVHSKMEGRDETIKQFKSGQLRALVNNNVLTTGFDFPGIDLIIVLRATTSSVLWVQMLGRGTRPDYAKGFDLNTTEGRLAAIGASEKHDCLVLDYARNTQRLGPINDPVVPRRKGAGGGDAPVKVCPACDTYNHATARYCGGHPFKTNLGCGHEFLFEVKFKETAATDELIRAELPVTKVFRVDHITCEKHNKIGKPPSIRVTYYCGHKSFTDYVCPEHPGWALSQAQKWWKLRSDDPLPATTDETLEVIDRIKPATHLRVWINKQYPEIMAYCFDGTAFGEQEATDFLPEVEGKRRTSPLAPYDSIEDDDVPF